MITGLISEVCNDGRICMAPSAYMMVRNLLLANIDGKLHSHFSGEKHNGQTLVTMKADGQMLMDYIIPGDCPRAYAALNEDDQFVNIVYIMGPMTRGGDECTYGSMDIRDQIMCAADQSQCRGHIVYINTGGGMASCLPDYRMAFNYARSKGQRVDMIIDGACYSCGAFTGAMCDHRWFINPEDGIGSLGMYMAFFTLADGEKNQISGETYHEYYASKSPHKNEWYREAAKGNMDLVKEETDRDLEILLANLKSDLPTITDEQMKAGEFKCADVIGTLVDGQSTIQQVAADLIADYNARGGEALPLKLGASTNAEPAEPSDPAPVDDDNAPVDGGAAISNPEPTNPNPTTTMTTYTAIPAAIGEEAMETVDGELTLQPEQAAALEQRLTAGFTHDAALQARIDQLTQQLSEQEAAHQTAIDQLNAEHATAIEQLNTAHAAALTDAETAHATALTEAQTAHAAAIEELNNQHSAAMTEAESAHAAAVEALNQQHAAALAEAQNQTAAIQQQLTEQQQRVADLTSQVEALNAAPGQQSMGAQPASNGSQAPAVKPGIVTQCKYDPSLSAEENARRRGK